jgi:hypothetical protein
MTFWLPLSCRQQVSNFSKAKTQAAIEIYQCPNPATAPSTITLEQLFIHKIDQDQVDSSWNP